MMAISLSQLIRHVGGARITRSPQTPVTGVAYDSRRSESRATSLFVSRGFVYDGHHFAEEAVRRGRGGALGREGVAGRRPPDRRGRHAMGDGPMSPPNYSRTPLASFVSSASRAPTARRRRPFSSALC